MYFRNYRLWKTYLDHFLKSYVWEHALTVNMWKHPKYLQNIHESTFIFFSSFSEKFISKLSPGVLGEIFRVFGNTLTPDDKYPAQER